MAIKGTTVFLGTLQFRFSTRPGMRNARLKQDSHFVQPQASTSYNFAFYEICLEMSHSCHYRNHSGALHDMTEVCQ